MPGAYRWAVPIHHCPLDHMLNPAELKPSPASFVREYSFASNPRTPPPYRTPTPVAIDVAGGGAERAKLSALRSTRALHVTNLAAISDELWAQAQRQKVERKRLRRAAAGGGWAAAASSSSAGEASLLSADEWRAFRQQFAKLQGGWCCAPHGQQPHASGFHILHA